MHRSTEQALGNRAKCAALWLEYWKKVLLDEMKRQDVQLLKEPGLLDDDVPMTVTRGTVRALIQGMRLHIAEIRRFSS